jgi:hypothetical protein
MDKHTIIQLKAVHDDDFACMCLKRLYDQQTGDEQAAHDAHHKNGQGFTKADALTLTVYAQMLNDGATLPRKEMADLHQRLPKYSKQLCTLLTDDEVE